MILTELVDPVAGGRLYEGAFRAGLGDAAPTGRVRLDTIARWAQDVAFNDVEDAGLGDRAAWVVRRMRLKVERFPRFREPVVAATFASGFGRMWAERRTTLTGPEAHVEAVALWVHLDPGSGRPVPFDDDELATWSGSANGRQVKARLRHPAPPEDVETRPWRFRATDLDFAEHVNNAVYWEALEEQLIERPEEPGSLDAEIEFREAAQPGEALIRSAPGRLWITAADDDRVHASIYVAT
jgi:acyl-ACP thioesterase